MLNIYGEYLLCLQPNASGSFLQECTHFAKQRLTYWHFEGGIIPYTKKMLKDFRSKIRRDEGSPMPFFGN